MLRPFTVAVALAKDQSQPASVESVAAILTRSKTSLIKNWLVQTKNSPELSDPPLSDSERTEHLPKLIDDLLARLGGDDKEGPAAIPSLAAVECGERRLAQGYSSVKLIHEWRIFQDVIFGILHENLSTSDFELRLPDIMSVVGAVDARLIQTLDAFANARTDSAVA